MATVTYDDARLPRGRAKAKPPRRRVVIWFVIVALLLGLVGGGLYGFDRVPAPRRSPTSSPSQVPPPTPVAAAPAEVGPMPHYLDGIGTLAAVREVKVAPEVEGRVDGDQLRAPAPSSKRARRWSSSTTRPSAPTSPATRRSERLAIANLERLQRSWRSATSRTQATVDENQQALEAGASRHRPQPGGHRPEADQGALRRRARHAPGRARPVCQPGRHAGDADRPRPALRQLHPARAGRAASVAGRAAGRAAGRRLPGRDLQGRPSPPIEPQIDPATRVIQLQATLANPEHRLLPGMFANAHAWCCRRSRTWSPSRRPRSTRRSTAIWCSSCSEDGKDADGKPKQKAVQTFVETGAGLRRPDRHPTRRRAPGDARRERRASSSCRTARRSTVTGRGPAPPGDAAGPMTPDGAAHEIHRHLRPPAGAGAVVSLLILLIGAARLLRRCRCGNTRELKNTTITVTTSYPGASPDLMQGFITTPIAQAVATRRGHRLPDRRPRRRAPAPSRPTSGSTTTRTRRHDRRHGQGAAGQVPDPAARRNDPVILKSTGDRRPRSCISASPAPSCPAPAITDYLTRVVQPLLATVDGRRLGRDPGRPDLRDAGLARSRPAWRRAASRPPT